MKRKVIIAVIISLILCLSIGSIIARGNSTAFDAGEALSDSLNTGEIIASYNGYDVTSAEVDAQKKLLYTIDEAERTKIKDDGDIVKMLVENKILQEEAERLGFAATAAEIEEMVNMQKEAYAIPEGKEFLDEYCSGAGITIDEFYEIIREKAPGIISRQKMENDFRDEYCVEHNIERDTLTPAERTEVNTAWDTYRGEIISEHSLDVNYYTN